MDIKNRKGVFTLSTYFVESEPEDTMAIMGKCVILRVEAFPMNGVIEYQALSPDFDEVDAGEFTPEYIVLLSESGQNVEFRRSKG